MTTDDTTLPLTYSIIEAGKMLDLGKDASYAAANAGQIPVLKLGKRRKRVPGPAFRRMLETGRQPSAA